MASQAKYTIHIPTHDNLGQPLRDLATAAHRHLFQNGVIEGSYIEPGKKGNWRNDPQETFDHLVTYAEDKPETDSHLKQTATHIADLANQWGVTVTKEGPKGPMLWIVDNPGYRDGEGAHPDALPYVPVAQRGTPPSDSPLARPAARRASAVDYLTSGASLAN
jgi:hypothetical protein